MNWLAHFRRIWHSPDLYFMSRPRHPWAGLLLLAGACIALVAGVWPVFAAVELVDYQVRSTQNDILLLWNTAHEYDLSGFEVMCKQASEPDTAYHSIGFREAQGGPQRGGQYFFLINRGLTPAQTYCFRLQEKTTNNQPGEVFDRCGYGLGITPTPALTITAIFTSTSVLTNTSVFTGARIFTNTAAFTSVLMISGTPGIALPQAVTNNGVFSNVATITPAAILPTPIVVSPLQTPAPTVFNPGVIPTGTPLLTLTPGVITTPITSLGTPITTGIPATVTIIAPPPSVPAVPTPSFTATSTVTQISNLTPASGAQINNGLTSTVNQAAANPPVAQAPGIPNPSYLVVTAIPPPTVLALPLILTPLSTATTVPSLNLATLAQPGMQNIIILLLCFTFLGASGLGVVGLLTSVLYMRSRNQDRNLNGVPILIDKSPKRRTKL